MKCCDPFICHKSAIKGCLRLVTEDLPKEISAVTRSNVKPGQKLCPTCIKKLQHVPESTQENPNEDSSSSAEENPPWQNTDTHTDILQDSFETLGVSPLKKHGIRVQDRAPYAKRKISNVEKIITAKVAKTLDISQDEISRQQESTRCIKCGDLHVLMSQLKVNILESPRLEKLQLLTVVPESWSIDRTAQEFQVSQYLVRKSLTLKKTSV